MREEETQHLPCRVRPSWIGVRAGAAASRPGVAGTVNIPMLGDRPSPGVGKDHAGIGMPVGHRSTNHLRWPYRFGGLPENSLAVVRMHRVVAVTMENDGRYGRSAIHNCFGLGPLPHGDERGRKIAGGPAG